MIPIQLPPEKDNLSIFLSHKLKGEMQILFIIQLSLVFHVIVPYW